MTTPQALGHSGSSHTAAVGMPIDELQSERVIIDET